MSWNVFSNTTGSANNFLKHVLLNVYCSLRVQILVAQSFGNKPRLGRTRKRCYMLGVWGSQLIRSSAEVVMNQFKVLGVGEDWCG